jgi:hypothetical protein
MQSIRESEHDIHRDKFIVTNQQLLLHPACCSKCDQFHGDEDSAPAVVVAAHLVVGLEVKCSIDMSSLPFSQI